MYELTASPYSIETTYFSLDAQKSPKEIDKWVEKDGRKDVRMGIYEVSESNFRLLWGTSEVRPKSFDEKDAAYRILSLERMTIPLKATDIERLR